MAKKSKAIKKKPKDPTTLRNFKTTDAEWKEIKAKAKRFARGNVSNWLRYAGMNFTPRAKDLE